MIGFLIGSLLTGTVLAIMFGALHLDAEEEAYRRGYHDGRYDEKNRNQVSEGTDR